MRRATVFTNPKTGETYSWPINHSEEAPVQKSRQMGDGAPTSNIGLIPQQGAPIPLKLQWKGRIFTLAQLQAFCAWWQVCEAHSIYLTDPAGFRYEVIITDFEESRIGVAQNRWDPVNAPSWIWEYTMTMRVLRVFSGEWTGIAP